jgi:NAD-dependent dihydropyrimidine dehydrogenase PreA subunit
MIQVAIDEEACVGCTLCVEICPTDVFEFDEAAALPRVEHVAECFGCLSCSELCPAGAVDHDGIELSETYHHDPYALRLASRLASDTKERWNAPDSPEKRAQAVEDLGVRLVSMAEVFRRTIGGSLPAVGTMAGRTLARHLPRYQEPQSLVDAMDLATHQFAPAWSLEPRLEGDDLTIAVGDCFVREVCQREGIELGGDLCTLFYNYLGGYVGKMGKVRLRLMSSEPGPERCTYQVKVYR